MINNTENQALTSKKNLALVVFIPLLFVVLLLLLVINLGDILTIENGLWLLSLLAVMVYVLITLPALVVLLLIERNRLAMIHNQLLQSQGEMRCAQLHCEQFIQFMPQDLSKRLGFAPLVLYRLFFPQSLHGDLTINESLLRFIHHSFAELVQAAEVIGELQSSEDQDEQVVKNNRLSFVIEQSVGLMYFIAKRGHGHAPDCQEAYFVKDALADYFDLTAAVVDFALLEQPQFDITVVYDLFGDKSHQSWFKRNSDLLAHHCKLCTEQNPFAEQFKNWR